MNYARHGSSVIVEVDPRVMQIHPELVEEDVIHAVEHEIDSMTRIGTFPVQTAGIGMDSNGRLVEWVKIPLDKQDGRPVVDGWFVYHAMTPPAKKMLKEVGLI